MNVVLSTELGKFLVLVLIVIAFILASQTSQNLENITRAAVRRRHQSKDDRMSEMLLEK